MTGWLPVLAWAISHYDLVDVDVTHPAPDITRTEYHVVAGSNDINRFSITHVSRDHVCFEEKSPVILLSPFLLPGSFYEITETGDYAQSAAGMLARDGYDLWLVDQRRTGLAPGACESTADCSAMQDWDFATLAEDGLLAVSMARALHPNKKPVVGGFSAGANATMALVNRAPQSVSGAFLYEGTFYTEDPTIISHNEAICQQLDAAMDAGQFYDPGASVYNPLLALAAADPNGISPIPAFAPGTTNQQALFYVYSAPAPAGAVAPTPWFVRCIADFSTLSFVYTNPNRLFGLASRFDNYAALAPMRDLACGLAGIEDTHYDHLGAFKGDLLVFVEGTGFGPAMFDTASLFTGARSVTIDHHPELGEADPYFHVAWQDVFYAPLKQWLDAHEF